jgi:hypothetical protein
MTTKALIQRSWTPFEIDRNGFSMTSGGGAMGTEEYSILTEQEGMVLRDEHFQTAKVFGFPGVTEERLTDLAR